MVNVPASLLTSAVVLPPVVSCSHHVVMINSTDESFVSNLRPAVHSLCPNHIQVIGALGDSITVSPCMLSQYLHCIPHCIQRAIINICSSGTWNCMLREKNP